MRFERDEDTGFLRVDDEGLQAIAQVVPALEDMAQSGQELDEESEEILAAVDSIPGLRQSMRAFSDPVYVLVVARGDGEQVTTVRCWFRTEGCAIVLPAGEDQFLTFGISPVQLPALVAQLVSLSARDGDVAPVTTDGTQVDRLLSDDAAVRAEAIGRLGVDPGSWLWQVQRYRGVEMTELDGVMIGIDSKEGLRRAVSVGGDELRFDPVAPLDVWTELIRFVLPDDLPDPQPAETAAAQS